MNIKHHRVLVLGKKKPVFENPSLRCTGRLAQGAREPIKQGCNNPKTKPCLVGFQAFGGAGAGAVPTEPRTLPELPPVRPRTRHRYRSYPEVGAASYLPARHAALPKPVPLPASSSPPCSASSTFSKVYLLTFKPLYFHAGSR